MATVARDYYKTLLVSQYFGLPKASQTIEALTDMLFVDDLALAIGELALDFNSVGGERLNVIASIVGLSRSYTKNNQTLTLNDHLLREAIRFKILRMNVSDSIYDIQSRLLNAFGSSPIDGTEPYASGNRATVSRANGVTLVEQGVFGGEVYTFVNDPTNIRAYRGSDFETNAYMSTVSSRDRVLFYFPEVYDDRIFFIDTSASSGLGWYVYNSSNMTIGSNGNNIDLSEVSANGVFTEGTNLHYYNTTETKFKKYDFSTFVTNGLVTDGGDSDLFRQFNNLTFSADDRFATDLKYFYKYSAAATGRTNVYEFTSALEVTGNFFDNYANQNNLSNIFIARDLSGDFTDTIYLKKIDQNTGDISPFEAHKYVDDWPVVALQTQRDHWSPATKTRGTLGDMEIRYEFDRSVFNTVFIDFLIDNDIIPRPTGVSLFANHHGGAVHGPRFGFRSYKKDIPSSLGYNSYTDFDSSEKWRRW